MSQYFDDACRGALEDQEEAVGVAIVAIQSEATLNGWAHGSQMYLAIQTALVDGVGALTSVLVEKLTEHGHDNTPIVKADFDAACAALQNFAAKMVSLYESKRRLAEPFGGGALPLEQVRLAKAVRDGRTKILGHRHSFGSKRSPLKAAGRFLVSAAGQAVATWLTPLITFALGFALKDPLIALWHHLTGG